MFHFFVLRSVTSYSGTCLRALLIGRWDSWSSCEVAMLWHATSIQPGVCLGKNAFAVNVGCAGLEQRCRVHQRVQSWSLLERRTTENALRTSAAVATWTESGGSLLFVAYVHVCLAA